MGISEGNAKVSFDDNDQAMINFLADYFNKHGSREISINKIIEYVQSEPSEIRERLNRFIGFQMVQEIGKNTIEILPNLLEASIVLKDKRDHDYWKSCELWFRSKWWSLPALFFIVLLPLIVQWIEMIKTVMQWLGLLQET